MAKTKSKYIDFGTGSGQVSSRDLPANFTPSNYTPAQVASEGTDKVSAHLKGLDTALGSGGGSLSKYTSTQALAANWASNGSGYRQEVTLPGSLTMGGCQIQTYVNGSNKLVYAEIEEGTSNTKFYVYTNDNTLTYNFVIIG